MGREILEKIKQRPDQGKPRKHVEKFRLYPKWHGKAMKCFQQVSNMIKF